MIILRQDSLESGLFYSHQDAYLSQRQCFHWSFSPLVILLTWKSRSDDSAFSELDLVHHFKQFSEIPKAKSTWLLISSNLFLLVKRRQPSAWHNLLTFLNHQLMLCMTVSLSLSSPKHREIIFATIIIHNLLLSIQNQTCIWWTKW